MINIRKTGEAIVLDIVEDLITPYQAAELDKTLEEVASEEVDLVIINLSQVQHVNGTSLGIVVSQAAEFRRESKDIKLVGLVPHIKRTLDVVKGNEVIEIYENEDDAIKSFSNNVTQVERNVLFGFK